MVCVLKDFTAYHIKQLVHDVHHCLKSLIKTCNDFSTL